MTNEQKSFVTVQTGHSAFTQTDRPYVVYLYNGISLIVFCLTKKKIFEM